MEVPTEKRVKRWALSMEELMSDPTGRNFSIALIEYRVQFRLAEHSRKHYSARNRFTRVHELFKKGVQPREHKILAGGQRSQAQFPSTNTRQSQRNF